MTLIIIDTRVCEYDESDVIGLWTPDTKSHNALRAVLLGSGETGEDAIHSAVFLWLDHRVQFYKFFVIFCLDCGHAFLEDE